MVNGKPCKRCGGTLRFWAHGKCVSCAHSDGVRAMAARPAAPTRFDMQKRQPRPSGRARIVVYGVSSTEDGVVRYVGSTGRTLATRLSGLVSKAKAGYGAPVDAWIRAVLADGHRPAIQPLIDPGSHAAELREIRRRVAAGEPLVNVEGNAPAEASRRRAAAATRHANVVDRLAREAVERGPEPDPIPACALPPVTDVVQHASSCSGSVPLWVIRFVESPEQRHRWPRESMSALASLRRSA